MIDENENTKNENSEAPEAESAANVSPPETAGAADQASASPSGDLPPGDQLAAVEKERDEFRDRMLRVAADFENWKRRSRKDLEDAKFTAKERVLRDMLEVVDNLERAVASSAGSTPSDAEASASAAPILEGVNLVLRLFQSKLERHDVKAVQAEGKPFDPHVHDAVSRQPTADAEPGTVVAELVRGYVMGERLLRAASVVVAAPLPASDESKSD